MGAWFLQESNVDSILQEIKILPNNNTRMIGETGLNTFKVIGSSKLQSFNCINSNRRIYGNAIKQKFIEEANNKINSSSTFFGGELDHPLVESLPDAAALKRQLSVMLKECSHVFRRVWDEGDILCGTCETLSTDNGRKMGSLAAIDNVPIGFSARALGRTKPAVGYGKGAVEVVPPLCLCAYDCVQNPSHQGSVMTEITSIIKNTKDLNKISENDSDGQILSESFSDVSYYRDLFLADTSSFDFLIESVLYDKYNCSQMNPTHETKFVKATMDSILQEFLQTTPDTIDGKSSIEVLNESNVEGLLQDYANRRSEYTKISDVREGLRKFLNL